jgi:hypothetical protein
MKTLPEFLMLARKKYLQARSLDYYLATDIVQELINKATVEQREQLWILLEKGDRELFSALVDKIRDSDTATMSVAALRNLARSLGIYDYQKMCKEQLLILIGEIRARKVLENERRLREATDERISAS